jgi:hypothetical protein
MEEELTNKDFIFWLCDLRCPFIVHYNGEDNTQSRITFDKGSKNYTLDQVWQFWNKEVKNNV